MLYTKDTNYEDVLLSEKELQVIEVALLLYCGRDEVQSFPRTKEYVNTLHEKIFKLAY